MRNRSYYRHSSSCFSFLNIKGFYSLWSDSSTAAASPSSGNFSFLLTKQFFSINKIASSVSLMPSLILSSDKNNDEKLVNFNDKNSSIIQKRFITTITDTPGAKANVIQSTTDETTKPVTTKIYDSKAYDNIFNNKATSNLAPSTSNTSSTFSSYADDNVVFSAADGKKFVYTDRNIRSLGKKTGKPSTDDNTQARVINVEVGSGNPSSKLKSRMSEEFFTAASASSKYSKKVAPAKKSDTPFMTKKAFSTVKSKKTSTKAASSSVDKLNELESASVNKALGKRKPRNAIDFSLPWKSKLPGVNATLKDFIKLTTIDKVEGDGEEVAEAENKSATIKDKEVVVDEGGGAEEEEEEVEEELVWAGLGRALVAHAVDCDIGEEAFDEVLEARKQLEVIIQSPACGYESFDVYAFGGVAVMGLMEVGGDVDFSAVGNDIEPLYEEAQEIVSRICSEMRRLGLRAAALPKARVPLIKVDRVSHSLPGSPLHSNSTCGLFQFARPLTAEEQGAFVEVITETFAAVNVEWIGNSSSNTLINPREGGKEAHQTSQRGQNEAERALLVPNANNSPGVTEDITSHVSLGAVTVGSGFLVNEHNRTAKVHFPDTSSLLVGLTHVRKLGAVDIPIRIPIDPRQGPELYRFPFDFCLSSTGLRNSYLVGQYLRLYPYGRHLALALKRWGRSSGVVNSTEGLLASYAIMIMLVHYLVKARVIPEEQTSKLASLNRTISLEKDLKYYPLADLLKENDTGGGNRGNRSNSSDSSSSSSSSSGNIGIEHNKEVSKKDDNISIKGGSGEGDEIDPFKANKELLEKEKEDLAVLGYLFAGFFEYYSNVFNYETDVVSTTEPNLKKSDIGWDKKMFKSLINEENDKEVGGEDNEENEEDSKLPGNDVINGKNNKSDEENGPNKEPPSLLPPKSRVVIERPPFYYFSIKDPYGSENIGRNLGKEAQEYVKHAFELAFKYITLPVNTAIPGTADNTSSQGSGDIGSSSSSSETEKLKRATAFNSCTLEKNKGKKLASLTTNDLVADPKFFVNSITIHGPKPCYSPVNGTYNPKYINPENSELTEAFRKLKRMEFNRRRDNLQRFGQNTMRQHNQVKVAQKLTRSVMSWLQKEDEEEEEAEAEKNKGGIITK